jgi:hypothetical protein
MERKMLSFDHGVERFYDHFNPPTKPNKRIQMKIATILGLIAALAGFSLTSCGSAPEEAPPVEAPPVEVPLK